MARRQTKTFSMSFLDVISCGFGAVVLFYTIISAQSGLYRIKERTDLSAEARGSSRKCSTATSTWRSCATRSSPPRTARSGRSACPGKSWKS